MEKKYKTSSTSQEFLEALWKSAGLVTIACEQSGFSYKRYKKELENNEDFKLEVEFMKEKLKDAAEAELYKLIEKGYDKAIFFYLKNKAADRGYGSSLTINHSQFEQPLLKPLDSDVYDNYKLNSPNSDKNDLDNI